MTTRLASVSEPRVVGWKAWSVMSESEGEASRELDVVARLAIGELAAEALEAGDVVTRLEAKADLSAGVIEIESDRSEAEPVGLSARVGDIAQTVGAPAC